MAVKNNNIKNRLALAITITITITNIFVKYNLLRR